jgi:hypothetical protein
MLLLGGPMADKRAKKDLFRSLSPEEVRTLKPLTKEDVLEALRKGNEDRRKAEKFIHGQLPKHRGPYR